tara:strand:+ start:273 stop:749 length:477 start_codon:yes stop_codon:yes gene_type:complete
MLLIGTTRFNQETWTENSHYRSRKKFKGCIYGCPKRIATTVPIKSGIAILEMNNSENKIMGIGLIVNYLRLDKNYNIYSDGNYNRYVYLSKYRIDRSELKENEESLIKYFEAITFYGSGHLKRGQGITLVPKKKIENYTYQEIPVNEFIMEMFRRRYN